MFDLFVRYRTAIQTSMQTLFLSPLLTGLDQQNLKLPQLQKRRRILHLRRSQIWNLAKGLFTGKLCRQHWRWIGLRDNPWLRMLQLRWNRSGRWTVDLRQVYGKCVTCTLWSFIERSRTGSWQGMVLPCMQGPSEHVVSRNEG